MSKKSTQKYNQKQLNIMNEALKIFAQKGYNGASVRDLAHASKINLAMINYYFGSKIQLLEAIFEHMTDVSKNYFANIILDDSLTPIEKLDQIIENYVRFAIENSAFIIVLMRQQFSLKNEAINDMIYALKYRYWRIFYNALEEAKKSGDFRQDADITTITSMVMGSLNFLISDRNFLSKSQNINFDDDASYNELIYNTMKHIKLMLHNYLITP